MTYVKYNTLLVFLLVIVIVWLRNDKFWQRKLFENKWQVAGFLAILFIGILARTLFFNTYPPPDGRFSIEEVQAGRHSFPLVSLFADPAVKFLGGSMFNLRLPFVLLSYLSIIFFYIACRLYFKTYFAAIFATGLLATSSILATTSRIAIEWFTPITTFSLALAGIFYACTRRDWAAFAIAGFTTGLALLEYQGFKYVILLCLLWFLTYFFAPSESYCNSPRSAVSFSNFKRHLPKILFMLFFVFITFLPEVINDARVGPFGWFTESYHRHNDEINREQAEWTQEQVIHKKLHNINTMLNSIFLRVGDRSFFQGSMTDYFTGLLGILAFVYCILFFKHSQAKLLPLITIPTTLVAMGIFTWNPNVKYAVPLIPLYFLTIGIFIDDIGQVLRRNKIVIRALIILLASLMAFNLHQFFFVELHDNYRAVHEQFYTFEGVLAHQIALLQQKDNTAVINLMSDQQWFALPNDYSWLYDISRVKYISTEEQLSNTTGYVLAHDKYIDMVKKFSSPEKCKQWKTQFDRNEMILCELNPSLNSTYELSVKNVSGQ